MPKEARKSPKARAKPAKTHHPIVQRGEDAVAREAAISDILRVIASSPSDLQPVFDTILAHTLRFCEGEVDMLWQFDGEKLRFAAHRNSTVEGVAYCKAHPLELGTYNPTPQAALERRIVQVLDVFANPNYRPLIPVGTSGKRPNAGTVLAVPLLREDELFGVITIWRYEKRPFSERQIELVKTFTAQAIIAIQNVRLFNETREALEQQTATAGILRVITSSPTDLTPVMATVVENAARLADANHALIGQAEGPNIRWLAAYGCPLPSAVRPITRELPSGRAMLDLQTTQVEDVAQITRDPNVERAYRELGVRSIFATPLVREGRAIGVLLLRRTEVRPFTQKQTELLRTFADQAAIAIENVRLFNETKESLERQTATADILRVISGSPNSVQPVFEAILENATRLCEAQLGFLFLPDGEVWNMVSHRGASAETQEFYRNFRVGPNTGLGRMIRERHPVHIEDLVADAATSQRDPLRIATIEKLGARTFLAVPLLKDGEVIGAVVIYRKEVRPFGEPQIRLLSTFADQAVIAIENVRLFNETKESLERQTATSEILRVIAGSPDDVQPVFDTIVRNAVALCNGMFANAFRYDGERLHFAASSITNPEARKLLAEVYPRRPDKTQMSGRAVLAKAVVRMEDALSDPDYDRRHAEIGGWRRMLGVPMLRDGDPIGAIVVAWADPGPISKAQELLLQTFADQAVIAIENVRLFNETKEALERQTATADILRVISSTPTDTRPVFEAIVQSALRMFGGMGVGIALLEAGGIISVAEVGRLAGARGFGEIAMPLGRESASGRAIIERAIVNIPDIEAPDAPAFARERGRAAGFRAIAAAPMLRGDEAVGAILIMRESPGPLNDKQLQLLKTFADQAVIAIENVRLFNETKEALEQQTAISEVLRVISNSPADVQPVLEAVAERAAKICDAVDAQIFLRDGEDMKHVARFGPIPIGIELGDARPLSRGWVAGRAVLEGKALHIEDLLAVPREEYPVSHELRDRAGHRTLLSVPLMRERKALGAISLRRMEVRPFTEKQIALLRTFADQAAIAIQNVRLFNETKEALEQQKASAEVLGVISSSIADTTPVFDKILESCHRLFEGHLVGLTLVGEDRQVYLAGYFGPHQAEMARIYPMALDRTSGTGCAILDQKVVHFPDVAAEGTPPQVVRGAQTIGFKSIIFAPLIGGGSGIGALWVARVAAGAFSEKEISLLQTFANQAVIAIQNARLFREIQEKSAQLEVANKHKSDFLANMSHELRTPLNAIIGFSEALMERMFGEVNAKQADYLKDIHESGRHLLSLINDILDLSKIEAGRMDLELSTFHLPTALSNAMTLVRERAQRHSIDLNLQLDERLGEFQADERKFKQIMLNLLSNAVKFTPDGGRVDVCATKDTDKVEIAVKDTGIGIAPEDQAVVFEEFKQVGRDQMRKAEGTGLGLALTKRFVELHGGAIRLESTPGKGSTFTVSLPVRAG